MAENNHHSSERMPNRRSSRSCAHLDAAEGRSAEEPQDLRVSGRGVARDRGGDLQLHRQEDAAQQAAAKGQPPQPTLQDNTDNNVQDLKNQLQAERQKEQQQAAMAAAAGRSSAWRLRRPRNRPLPRPMARPALQCRAAPASPARRPSGQWRSKAAHARRSLLRSSSRHSSLPRKSANGPTTPASLRILCTPALAEQQPQQSRQQGQTTPVQSDHTERQTKTSLVAPRAAGEQAETRARVTSGRWRQTSIQPPASPISSMKVRFSTRF